MSLTEILTELFQNAFRSCDLPPELGEVRASDRPELAQFQCNGAMPAAKVARKNPREIAQQVIDTVERGDVIARLDIAGPGFINIQVTNTALVKSALREDSTLPQLARGETVILDYGGPNIAKPMHVGHLRTAIIGDVLRRMLNAVGYQALGDIHMGDWGTHLGLLFNAYIDAGEEALVLEADADNPEDVARLFLDMAERYPAASAAAKADESGALQQQARETTVKLQQKEQPYLKMFENIRAVSVKGMEKNYAALNVHFDLWKGEAIVHDLIAPMVESLKQKGFAIEDDGAWIMPVAQNDDKKEMPPLILYKRDGGVMYGTTDLATLVDRAEEHDPAWVIYVVDQRQSLHFEQLFRAARRGGIITAETDLTFAGIGTMNGPDGKPFKTRAGGVMRLEDVIETVTSKARERLDAADLAQDMDPEERARVAAQVGVAALKFADLQNQRHQDYIFDLERMSAFEGKTGPYLLYQAVRIKSLLRKAADQGLAAGQLPDMPENLGAAEQALALRIVQFPDAFRLALKNLTPHVLCEYLYSLATEFSSFYAACPVLVEPDTEVRDLRLELCRRTLDVLDRGLDLAGIDIPERM